MDKVQPYPKHILAMQTMEGFLEVYNRYHVAYNDAELAYDATDDFYKTHFGKPKYSSFEVFRKCKNEYLRKKSN